MNVKIQAKAEDCRTSSLLRQSSRV